MKMHIFLLYMVKSPSQPKQQASQRTESSPASPRRLSNHNPPANGLTIQASVELRKWPRACILQQATTGQQVRSGSRQQARLGKGSRPSVP